jgi:predicted secreted Zn-dependent protease
MYIKGLHNRLPKSTSLQIIDIYDYDTIRFDTNITLGLDSGTIRLMFCVIDLNRSRPIKKIHYKENI